MDILSLNQVLMGIHGELLGTADMETKVQAVCTDSRNVEENSIFIPLVGENFDGHNYIDMALKAGAVGCVTAHEIAEENRIPGKFYIRVEDTMKALGELAAYYRSCFHIPVIAVTGSVGKTTTKDMVAAVLGQKYNVLKTDGNFNNNIGLPMTIFRMNHTHEIAVLEMGMNHEGEIDYLTNIAHPDVALITNIGDAHIENMGSRENTLKAKAEIFHGMTAEGQAVLNGDDPLLRTLSGKIEQKITWCGTGENCTWRVTDLAEHWQDHVECEMHAPDSTWMQEIPGLGGHMVYPASMAAAVGRMYGVSDELIRRGILEFEPTKMRMAILHRKDDITILNDTYNANPQSMRAAIEILSKQECKRRIAVLGDMMELGELGPGLHASVGRFLANVGIDCLITVGNLGACIADGAEESDVEIHRCANQAEAQIVLAKAVTPGSTILVKASRGMKFEHLVDYLAEITAENEA